MMMNQEDAMFLLAPNSPHCTCEESLCMNSSTGQTFDIGNIEILNSKAPFNCHG